MRCLAVIWDIRQMLKEHWGVRGRVMLGQREYGSLVVIHSVTGSKHQGGSQPKATIREYKSRSRDSAQWEKGSSPFFSRRHLMARHSICPAHRNVFYVHETQALGSEYTCAHWSKSLAVTNK